jgi:hypothetical protein
MGLSLGVGSAVLFPAALEDGSSGLEESNPVLGPASCVSGCCVSPPAIEELADMGICIVAALEDALLPGLRMRLEVEEPASPAPRRNDDGSVVAFLFIPACRVAMSPIICPQSPGSADACEESTSAGVEWADCCKLASSDARHTGTGIAKSCSGGLG